MRTSVSLLLLIKYFQKGDDAKWLKILTLHFYSPSVEDNFRSSDLQFSANLQQSVLCDQGRNTCRPVSQASIPLQP